MAAHIQGKLQQRSFRHMIDTVQHGANRGVPTRVGNRELRGFVPPKDRIAVWNIMSGDRVQIITGKMKGKTGTVDYVDRAKSRIYLLETEFCRRKYVPAERKNAVFKSAAFQPQQTVLSQVPVHYSNVALVMNRTPEQAAKDEAEDPEVEASTSHFIARRLRYRSPTFNNLLRRWQWKREAVSVARVSENGTSQSVEWSQKDRKVPWNDFGTYRPKIPNVFDTPSRVSGKSTFVPIADPVKTTAPELKIRDFEFSNPYSRAKKQEIWKAAREDD